MLTAAKITLHINPKSGELPSVTKTLFPCRVSKAVVPSLIVARLCKQKQNIEQDCYGQTERHVM